MVTEVNSIEVSLVMLILLCTLEIFVWLVTRSLVNKVKSLIINGRLI